MSEDQWHPLQEKPITAREVESRVLKERWGESANVTLDQIRQAAAGTAEPREERAWREKHSDGARTFPGAAPLSDRSRELLRKGMEDTKAGRVSGVPSEVTDIFASLSRVLKEAVSDARGKGQERHGLVGEAFEDQLICRIGRDLRSTHFQVGQAVKKALESTRVEPTDAAVRELRGAIVYLAAAILLLEEGR